MLTSTHSVFIISLVLLGCGASAGTRPHDMSRAEHQRAAAREEAQASEHARRSDPGSTLSICGSAGPGESACWTSIISSSEEHRRESERLQRLAAEHRRAAETLAEAERTSCAGLRDYDRDISPFAHRQDIESAKRIETHAHTGEPERPGGAVIVFRKVSGLTADLLRRMVDCHMARSAAMGHRMPEMSYCPLALKDVTATVSPVGEGFAVEVTSKDPAVAAEIAKRALLLAPTGTAGSKHDR